MSSWNGQWNLSVLPSLKTSKLQVGGLYYVSDLAGLPAPVGGVITLPALTTWVFTNQVDIGSNRIECDGIVTIKGNGQETSQLAASSLGAGLKMISTAYSITINAIELDAPADTTAVRVDGTGQPTKPACDWSFVNFTGDGRAVELVEVANSVNTVLGIFGDGFYVFGSIETIAFTGTIFVPGEDECGMCVDATASVTRRIRISESVVSTTHADATGFSVQNTSVTQAEGFILNLLTFTGPGTYIDGTTSLDDQARWIECRGIDNTGRIGEMSWENNATATIIANPNIWTKILGTSAAGPYNQRFSHANNQLTYTSQLTTTFRIVAVCDLSSSNNRLIAIRGYLNGTTPISIPQRTTTNGVGRSESIAWQGIIRLSQGDYIEMWVANLTDSNNVTVENFSVQIFEA